MGKFIQFISGADDAATFHSKNFINMSCLADGVLVMRFVPSSKGMSDAIDTVTIQINSDTEAAVMAAIANELAYGADALVVVCNDVTGNHIHPDINSCAITLDL